MSSVRSFAEVTSELKKPKLLLGNGFSRACRDDIFSYNSLFERADFSALPGPAKASFAALKTTDFEVVMDALRKASALVNVNDPARSGLAQQFDAQADGLREVLVAAIAQNHPAKPANIAEEEYARCRKFLSGFSDIYTLNYDLLLYWTLMQDEIPPAVKCDDGFRRPQEGVQPWVTWDSTAYPQCIHYLHGALHIYNAGPEVQKYTWCHTGLPLTEQVNEAIKDGKFPIFVAEGTAEQKATRINRSNFLGRSFRSFQSIGSPLVCFGCSLADSDRHIVRAIARGKVKELAISVYGGSPGDALLATVEEMKRIRLTEGRGRNPQTLNVRYFDAPSAKVWG